MIFVAIIEGNEYLVSNIIYIITSLYIFIQYLRNVLPISKEYKNTNIILGPLSLQQKYFWGIRWLLLTSILVIIIVLI
jgi:hypothetical protein